MGKQEGQKGLIIHLTLQYAHTWPIKKSLIHVKLCTIDTQSPFKAGYILNSSYTIESLCFMDNQPMTVS